MDLVSEERASDSPLVETVWRTRQEQPGPFISMAETQLSLVVTRYHGKTAVTLRGPATSPTSAVVLEGAEYFGVQFKAGVFLEDFPTSSLSERNEVTLPEAGDRSFWLAGAAWPLPAYDSVDEFVARIARAGLLRHDSIVDSVLRGQPIDMSARTVRRRFLRATGLTHGALYQIERARYAAALLQQGTSILDTVDQAGYFDQPHLTRALRRFIGLTPAQIVDTGRAERLSLLYKKKLPWLGYNTDNEGATNLKWAATVTVSGVKDLRR